MGNGKAAYTGYVLFLRYSPHTFLRCSKSKAMHKGNGGLLYFLISASPFFLLYQSLSLSPISSASDFLTSCFHIQLHFILCHCRTCVSEITISYHGKQFNSIINTLRSCSLNYVLENKSICPLENWIEIICIYVSGQV